MILSFLIPLILLAARHVLRYTGGMENKTARSNFIYLLRCSDGSLYVGWTNDLEKRIRAHQEGKGGKYTRSHRPVTLVYQEAFDTPREARMREAELKKLSHREKEQLILQRLDPGNGPA